MAVSRMSAVLAATWVAAAAGVATPPRTTVKSSLVSALGGGVRDTVLASPVTGEPLVRERVILGRLVSISYRDSAESGGRVYRDNGNYVDLTESTAFATFDMGELASSVVSGAQQLLSPAQFGREFFRNPTISFLYERGWRQQFNANGFPGIDKEFEEVMSFFEPTAAGETVLDMSCGSGLMTRRLAGAGKFGRVIGADYSEAMLLETARRFRGSRMVVPDLVRCDVANLPMQTGSLAAVHAGAAMHCWPEAEEGLKQIARVLKPGGAYFATTFLNNAFIGRRTPQTAGAGFRTFELSELAEMLRDAGFDPETIDVRKEGRACAVIRAQTPTVAPAL